MKKHKPVKLHKLGQAVAVLAGGLGACSLPAPVQPPQATQAIDSKPNGMICQKAHCQPAYSTHQADNGVPKLGPNVAVSA